MTDIADDSVSGHFPEAPPLDPLGDLDTVGTGSATKNRAKVGSARPSSLLYTYGPGATMDLPNFTVMPSGLDDWQRVYDRRPTVPVISAPRLLEAVRMNLGRRVTELRPYPWAPKDNPRSAEGDDLGVPARVFPQWLRCTGCDLLGTLPKFAYVNTNPFRPDQARFEHDGCRKRTGSAKPSKQRTVPARYLIACANGHLDEFPYDWWVHKGGQCSVAETPHLVMLDRTVGKGASATIECRSCGRSRPMNEAQGEAGVAKLPRCRGRHPHLAVFDRRGCEAEPKLMLLGASNLWFPSTLSAIVMPEGGEQKPDLIAERLREDAGPKRVERWGADLTRWRDWLDDSDHELNALDDAALQAVLDALVAPPETAEQREEQRRGFDPISLLVPEWQYLQQNPVGMQHRDDEASGLVMSPPVGGVAPALAGRGVTRVLAIDRLRKVNAVIGFTRIDEMERADDIGHRLVPLTRREPRWAVATEDRGEGIYLQLDEAAIAKWEARVEQSPLYEAHRSSHERNFLARVSRTAKDVEPDTRFRPARYWLVHTFAHVLIRELAMYAGYSAASLSERIYAWKEEGDRPAAAGVLIVTTASDSDGTLGGLVQLSRADDLAKIVDRALVRAGRCSSDPVCAQRVPKDPEDFLHGAACHTCAMASETSCERANRFLDRRFLVDLPGFGGYGFFG